MVKIYKNFNLIEEPEKEVFIKDDRIQTICGYPIDRLFKKENVYYLNKNKEYFLLKRENDILISLEFTFKDGRFAIKDVYTYVFINEDLCCLKENISAKYITIGTMDKVLSMLPYTEKEKKELYMDNLFLIDKEPAPVEKVITRRLNKVIRTYWSKTFHSLEEVEKEIGVNFINDKVALFKDKRYRISELYKNKEFLNLIKDTNITQHICEYYMKLNFMTLEQSLLKQAVADDLIYKGTEYASVAEAISKELYMSNRSMNSKRMHIRIIREGLGCSFEQAIDILKEFYNKKG